MKLLRALACTVALAGCSVGSGNTVNHHDAGHDAAMRDDANLARDTSDAAVLPDVGNDADLDAWMGDTGPDADLPDVGIDGGHDAAVITPPVVDGVVGTTEWAAAVSGTSSTATIWMGNQLTAIHAIAIGGTLYLAIEGQIESMNAMVVYIDGDPGGTHGVADLSSLTDSTPVHSLDDAISAGFSTPSTFRADVAWGTQVMSHVALSPDVTTGFRDITTDGSNFGWIPGSTVCTASACEASITTGALGPGPSPRTIALFARITQPDGTASPNQTLPMDNASLPRIVSVVLTIHE